MMVDSGQIIDTKRQYMRNKENSWPGIIILPIQMHLLSLNSDICCLLKVAKIGLFSFFLFQSGIQISLVCFFLPSFFSCVVARKLCTSMCLDIDDYIESCWPREGTVAVASNFFMQPDRTNFKSIFLSYHT